MIDITVLVAARTHAVGGRPVRSRADAIAAALALGLPSARVRLLTAGPMPETVAREYLALGATVLEVLACSDTADIPATLLPALRKTPWVLTGTRPESEQGTGLLPHALAAALQRPVITDVLAIEPDSAVPGGAVPGGAAWIITQALPKGARRRLRVTPPAVLAISAAAPQVLRHSLADAMKGSIMRMPVHTTAAPAPPTGQQVPRSKRPKVLEAKTVQSGHARMLGAIDSPTTGGTVLQAGTPHAKARAVLDYLRAHSLVHF